MANSRIVGAPKTARLIVTFDCRRDCHGCCNKYGRIMAQAKNIGVISDLPVDTNIVCITGGEPMLEPDRTLNIIEQVRQQCLNTKVYLYTAWWSEQMPDVLRSVDGVHYTIHDKATDRDIAGFCRFQQLIENHTGSFRIYVDPRVDRPVPIRPCCWDRIDFRPWLSEDELLEVQEGGLPIGETLYVLGA